MKKVIILALICFALSVPGPAFCESDETQATWVTNINLFLGSKFLDKDDWEPVEKQIEGGILFDIRRDNWWLSIAADLLYSRDDADITVDVLSIGTVNANAESRTFEVNVGVRKVWENFKYVRPFVGGGPAFIKVELEAEQSGVSISDDDTAFGVWIDAGVYVTLAKHLNLGIDARWSKATRVNLFNAEGEAGGWHIGALIGYHW